MTTTSCFSRSSGATAEDNDGAAHTLGGNNSYGAGVNDWDEMAGKITVNHRTRYTYTRTALVDRAKAAVQAP